MMIVLLAVPSLATGVLADKRLRRTLDNFGNLVREAQARSVAEHRTYLIVQDGPNLVVRAEAFAKGEKPTIAQLLKLEERKQSIFLSGCPNEGPADGMDFLADGHVRAGHRAIHRTRWRVDGELFRAFRATGADEICGKITTGVME